MFNSKEDQKTAEQASNSTSLINKGTQLTGDIESSGNIRIEGNVTGNVVSKAKAFLGQSSQVSGDIIAQNAELEGEVKGNIRVSDTLTLRPTAIIHGDIITNKLIVESGAAFNGQCKMGATPRDISFKQNEPTQRPIRQESVKAG
jgi:cytoskeletal protein CcmA (bactofilin family)